jgi:elongation factor Ts
MGGKTVAQTITDKIAKIGENMTLRRMARLTGDSVASYVHNAAAPGMGKIGVLVALTGADTGIGRQIAMHVAAANPVALSEDDIDPALVEREKAVLAEQARESASPKR